MLSWFLGYFFVCRAALGLDVKNGSIDLNYTTTPQSVHFVGLDSTVTCKFQPNGFDCDKTGWSRPKFYFDLKMEDCKTATVGNCPFNLNTFSTQAECHTVCRDAGIQQLTNDLSPRIFCRLQHDFGTCNDYHPKWYFDMTTRRCRGFSYSGCGGNLNRFSTQQACVTACSAATVHRP